MKYLKYFTNASDYQTFKDSEEYILPNVSYIEDSNVVMYGPAVKTLTYNMIDLGLPSGLLWADRNVGATSPEDAGLFFAWGETTGFTTEQFNNGERLFIKEEYQYVANEDGLYNKYNYDFVNNIPDTLLSEDDAATVNMGNIWRTPSFAEFTELCINTNHFIVDVDGIEYSDDSNNLNGKFIGMKLVSKINNNYIFIPFKHRFSDTIEHEGTSYLWTNELAGYYNSSNAISVPIRSSKWNEYDSAPDQRSLGNNVRGVCNK